jgi:hypothetical protein
MKIDLFIKCIKCRLYMYIIVHAVTVWRILSGIALVHCSRHGAWEVSHKEICGLTTVKSLKITEIYRKCCLNSNLKKNNTYTVKL